MAEFSKLVITNKGQALIAKMIAGEGSIEFTKVAASSKEYEENKMIGLDALEEVMQTTLISAIARTNEVAVEVRTAFSNIELTAGYYMRALGLYAADPDEGEVLYAVTKEISGCAYMPPYNGVTVTGAYITMITTVGNAEHVSLEVNPGAVVLIKDFEELKKEVEKIKETWADKFLEGNGISITADGDGTRTIAVREEVLTDVDTLKQENEEQAESISSLGTAHSDLSARTDELETAQAELTSRTETLETATETLGTKVQTLETASTDMTKVYIQEEEPEDKTGLWIW